MVGRSWAAVTYQNTAETYANNRAGTTGITLSNFNPGTGSNRLLVVGLSFGLAVPSGVTVTFGGTSLTQVPGTSSTRGTQHVEMWYVVNPTGTGNIVAKWSGTCDVVIGAVAFNGVDQTTPVRNGTFSTGTATAVSVTITSATGDMTMDTVSSVGARIGSPTQTQRWVDLNGNHLNGAGSTGAATVTHGWTQSETNNWVSAGVDIVAACAAVSDATYVAVNAQPTQAIVYWASSNPAIILQKAGAFITDAPVNNTAYSVGNTIGTSTVVYNGSVAETSFTKTGLTNGTTYYYKVFAKSSTCYSPGTSTQVIVRPVAGPDPAWSYMLANGSMLVAGSAGQGTIYTGSNASQIIALNTATGTQSWTPVATTQPIQAWLTWLPTYGGWPYRKPITIDHTKVTTALTYFPVLISLTDANLQTYAQASGNDIFETRKAGFQLGRSSPIFGVKTLRRRAAC